MSDYRTYVTQTGFGLERDAKFNNTQVELAVLVVGDGVLPDSVSPAEQTDLIHQVREYAITIEKDENDPNVWIARAEIPAGDGGFFIKEAGIKTKDGYLYAYARQAGDYKPLLSEGQGKSYTIRLKFIPGNADSIQIKIDPSVQFATPTDLDNVVKAHLEDEDPHAQYQTKALAASQAVTEKKYADSLQNKKKLFDVSGTADAIVLTSKAGATTVTELNDYDEFSFIVSETNTASTVSIKIDDLDIITVASITDDTQLLVTALATVTYIDGSFYLTNQINPKNGNPVSLIGRLITSPFSFTGAGKMHYDGGELRRDLHPILFALAQKDGLVDQATKDADLKAWGARFGDGDGFTTFTILTFDGAFIRFGGDATGLDVGRVLGSWQDATSFSDRLSNSGSGNLLSFNSDGNYSQAGQFLVTDATGVANTTMSKIRPVNYAQNAEFYC